jgi:hypothetical protein
MPPRSAPFRLLLAGLALSAAACRPGLIAGEDDGITAIPGCTADTTISCSGGAEGFTCAAGDNPESVGPSVSCSTPVLSPSGSDQYCCFRWTYGTSSCTPDDILTAACASGSYGYQCVDAADDPTSLDPGLHCSAPTPDFDGRNTDFCCTR